MAVTAISGKRTTAKTAATARRWKTLIAASSTSPMPPAPASSSTADSRTLIAWHDDNHVDQLRGALEERA